MIKLIARIMLSIITIFCLISVIVASSVKISNVSLFGNDQSRTQSFLYMLAMENRHLNSLLPTNSERTLGKISLELLTNINITDMKTFLISEIPGLHAASPKILIAGEGTDFTNLSIESPPPHNYIDWDEEEEEVGDHTDKNIGAQSTDYIAYIYHTHTQESYYSMVPNAKQANQAFHKKQNVTLLGKRLGGKLEERGIKTLVDTTDVQALLGKRGLKYHQSYKVSREIVEEAIAQNKKIDLIFDLHRDSAKKNVTTASIDGKDYAKIMFVIGTGNPNYEKNLAFAETLHEDLSERYPGISRGAIGKEKTRGSNGVYNQDLGDNALVIEIGGVENNIEELNRSVDALAEVISNYYWEDAVETSK